MAKRTTKRAVKMSTTKDLLNWLWSILGNEWHVHVSETTTLKIDRRSQRSEVQYQFFIMHQKWNEHYSETAGSVTELAKTFQTDTWAKIQREWLRRNPPARQKAIEVHQPKLMYSIPLASEIEALRNQ
jgi:hypothetical protein